MAKVVRHVVLGVASSHVDESLREIGDRSAEVGHDDVERRYPVEHARHDETGHTQAAAHHRVQAAADRPIGELCRAAVERGVQDERQVVLRGVGPHCLELRVVERPCLCVGGAR